MKNINGFDYSIESFNNYKLRLKLEVVDTDKEVHNIDIYTTQTDADTAYQDLCGIMTDKVKSFKIVHRATKEQDDESSKFIDEWLKEIKK